MPLRMFPAVVCVSVSILSLWVCLLLGRFSHLQGISQRPHNIPYSISLARLLSLGFRTPPLCRPCPLDSSSFRYERDELPRHRRSPWHLIGGPQSHWRKFTLLHVVPEPCGDGLYGRRKDIA